MVGSTYGLRWLSRSPCSHRVSDEVIPWPSDVVVVVVVVVVVTVRGPSSFDCAVVREASLLLVKLGVLEDPVSLSGGVSVLLALLASRSFDERRLRHFERFSFGEDMADAAMGL